MYNCCIEAIPNMKFTPIKAEEMVDFRLQLTERLKKSDTIPGTRSLHNFIPISKE